MHTHRALAHRVTGLVQGTGLVGCSPGAVNECELGTGGSADDFPEEDGGKWSRTAGISLSTILVVIRAVSISSASGEPKTAWCPYTGGADRDWDRRRPVNAGMVGATTAAVFVSIEGAGCGVGAVRAGVAWG